MRLCLVSHDNAEAHEVHCLDSLLTWHERASQQVQKLQMLSTVVVTHVPGPQQDALTCQLRQSDGRPSGPLFGRVLPDLLRHQVQRRLERTRIAHDPATARAFVQD